MVDQSSIFGENGFHGVHSSHLSNRKIKIRFWRDPDGPEVDWIIDEEGNYTPIEVKWTTTPKLKDIRHLKTFLSEYPSSQKGYLICQVPRKLKLDKQVEALPWQDVDEFLLS